MREDQDVRQHQAPAHELGDDFAPEPSYVEADSGGDTPLPPMPVKHDGPAYTKPYPADTFTTATSQTTSDGRPTMLAPRNPLRRMLTVVNTASAGGVVLTLAPSEGECAPGGTSGFALLPGASKDITSKAEVFVSAPSGSTGTFAVFAEFD